MEHGTLGNGALMDALDTYWKKNYRPPSIGDLSEAMGLSKSVVWRLLHELSAEGMIHLTPGTARSAVPLWVRRAINESPVGGGDGQSNRGP